MRAWLPASGLLLLVALTSGVACGGCSAQSPALRAARAGDRAALKREIDARHRAGTLTNAHAADLAKAVAERELAVAKGADAVERVRDLRACAHELDDALSQRMATRDAAGAEAAWARAESGALGASSARALASDPDDAWRAVGAFGLTRSDDAPARRRAMTDGSPRVRRAAMRAAAVAEDPADGPALVESARLDPEPLARTEAVRALTEIPPGPDTANQLRDLWVVADEPLRQDIALAWASPRVFESGGKEALRVLVASDSGPGALVAASAIARGVGGRDPELEASALALLARTIESGTRRDRLHALATAPLASARGARAGSPPYGVLEAARKAAEDDDVEVRTGALARLTELDAEREAAVKRLEAIGGQPGRAGARARLALASAGDVRVQAWIEADLGQPDPSLRLLAASGLASLGRAARAAPLLADTEPAVRARAACTLLMAARQGDPRPRNAGSKSR